MWGIRFGLPQVFTRPDEETIASVTGRILRNGANPEFFRYPTLFMYVMALVDRVRFGPGALADDASIYTTARIVAALLGTATVPLLFAAARRLFTSSAALVAAALLAVAFLHVRDSHFGVTDVPATFMVVAAFTAIVTGVLAPRSAHPGWRSVTLAGLLCGLAASTKYNAGLILFALLAAVPNAQMVAVALAAAAGGFLIGTPYALLARKQFLSGVLAERAHLAAGHGIGSGIGWVEHFVFSLRFGLGVWFLAAAVAGAIWLVLCERGRARIVILAFPVTYYVAMGAGRTVFVRYMLPLVPFAALLAGFAIDRSAGLLAHWVALGRRATPGAAEGAGGGHAGTGAAPGASGRRGSAALGLPWLPTIIAVGLAALAGADSFARSVALDKLLSQPDSRAIAAAVVRARFPLGASVFQTGAGYGHVMLTPENAYPEWPLTFAPRLVLVLTSRLAAYSGVPPTLSEDLARNGYHLIQRVEVENHASRVVPVFDQQDAFFVPLAGFDRFVRPGPTIEIYERR
jgi:4-amino-4-deoxy-L-arabinose transferase-like glycosyltransferase